VTPFAPIFVPRLLRQALSDEAWLVAMLDAERALVTAEAAAGVVPAIHAGTVAERCRAELFDVEQLAEEGRRVGNPAEPLVRALRELVGGEAARWVHWGATSQDVIDTAAMLVTQRSLDLVTADLDRVASACAALTHTHRSTPMVARTMLQQAVPTTFGAKAGGWLVAVLEARQRLLELRARGLAAQLGGAAGTLAALGERGPEVLRLYAAELGLAEPVVPWHTNRVRVAELGAALAIAAGALAKIALDVVLLAQVEVGEVQEAAGGGSSAMPQKRNPVSSTLALACARHVHANAGILTGSLAQEHERAAGAWHAEWGALTVALAFAGGTAAATADALEGLEVDAARMRANLGATGGLVVAERLSYLLAERLGRDRAHALVAEAAQRATAGGSSFRATLLADPDLGLTAAELDEALDPEGYLGSAALFADRALALFHRDPEEAR
jgi:3-carboxy-cis,cis-muconate cycloisomerase